MNKKIVAFLTALVLFQAAFAQDETDALRYSYLSPGGTARMQAIGGAGVSLGGDPGNMDRNPAGIGLFRTSDFSITPAFRSLNNQANYMQHPGSDQKARLYIQQLGLIFASDNSGKSGSGWQNITFGLGMNRLANFNSNLFYQGVNKTSSYSDNYLLQLQGETSYDNAAANYPFGASQAVLTGLIGPEVDSNNQPDGTWSSIVPVPSGITQSNEVSSTGGLNDYTLAVAGNYANKFYIGLSLDIPSIKYNRAKTFTETNTSDQSSPLQYYDVVEKDNTTGAGINGKLGIIYAVNSRVRVGAAFHSPSYFSMHDTYTTAMTTHTSDQGTSSSTTKDITGGYPGDYDYSLSTPWRAMGGLSLIFGNSGGSNSEGFLTMDYEYVNYADTRFHFNSSGATASDKALADDLNKSISSIYKGASNIRIGGELKAGIFAFRAGFSWMGSPYSDNSIQGSQEGYSAGLGFRNKGFYLDLTYAYRTRNSTDQPYYISANQAGLVSPPAATVTGNASDIILTIGFKL